MRTRPWIRRAAAATALLIGIATLGACGESSTDGPSTDVQKGDPKAEVKLTWWTGQDDSSQKFIDKLVAEFEADHPNVTIDATPGSATTDDLLGQLSASFAGGTYPDISFAYGSWASELASSGRTLDLTQTIADDPDVHWDEFSEAARATASPDGKTIGFPAVVDNLAVVYNKSLLAAAGLDEPSPDWTWEDFRADAKALTGDGVYGTNLSVSGGEDTTWRLWPLLWQNGGEILNEDETATAFDSPEGEAALETLRAMAVDDESVYLDQTDEKYGPLFREGRIGMMVTGPWEIYDTVQAGIDYGVVQLPGTDGDHTTVSGPDLWTLYDHQDPDRAYWSYELIKWMTQNDQDARFNLALGNLPLRSSAVGTPAFDKFQADYPGAEVFVANQENATIPRPTVAGYVGLSTAVGRSVAEVLQGAKSVPDALAEAAEKADNALKDAAS
jgi:multiple sugar transport system substrate-binding protein